MLRFNYVYRIENLINGKQYIGAHSTDNFDDGYMGSGKLLLKAFKKYGKDKFRKTILRNFDNAKEMYRYERELVNEEWINSGNYNIKLGGAGGGISNRVVSLETKLKISKTQKGKPKHPGFSEACRKGQLGKKQSKETIRKRALVLTGEKNGLFNKPSSKRNPLVWDNIESLRKIWEDSNRPGHGKFRTIVISLGYPAQSYQKIVEIFKGKMKFISEV
ncbi:homing endonuclease [Shewanella phage Thanatos-1]|nr:homing endonuclease [Shewanella phage Thanatos-1]